MIIVELIINKYIFFPLYMYIMYKNFEDYFPPGMPNMMRCDTIDYIDKSKW